MEQGWSGSTLGGPKTNGWLEGEARCVLPNGVVYEGQFKGGNFHGRGRQAGSVGKAIKKAILI